MAGHQVTTIGASLRQIGTSRIVAEYFPLLESEGLEPVIGNQIPEVTWSKDQVRDFISDIGFWLEWSERLRARVGLGDVPVDLSDEFVHP